jgi:KaiC/GvpD/RAD55 family RecA-like ATPase
MSKPEQTPGEGNADQSAAESFVPTGVFAHRTTLVLGRSNSAKTIFALQALVSAAVQGEAGLYVSFDSTTQDLFAKASAFGWDLTALHQAGLLYVDSRMPQKLSNGGKPELPALLGRFQEMASRINARRIILDGFHVLLLLLENPEAQMKFVFGVREWLFQNQFSAVITADLQSGSPPIRTQFSYLRFIADCAVLLDFRSEGEKTERFLRVLKYRAVGEEQKKVPFCLTPSGIQLDLPPKNILDTRMPQNPEIIEARRQLSARMHSLDAFLEIKQTELDFLIAQEDAKATKIPSQTPAAPQTRPHPLP